MKVAIIGRTEVLYDAVVLLKNNGHEIRSILTAKEAPEYSRTANDFKALAEELNVPFAQGVKIIDHVEFLESSGAEIGVSVNYPSIIPQSLIDLFPLGILNAHGETFRVIGVMPVRLGRFLTEKIVLVFVCTR